MGCSASHAEFLVPSRDKGPRRPSKYKDNRLNQGHLNTFYFNLMRADYWSEQSEFSALGHCIQRCPVLTMFFSCEATLYVSF